MTPGKLIYKLIFYTFRFFAKISTHNHFDCWYRNSIFLDYFKVGQSDLDITFYFKDDTFFLQDSLRIQELASKFFIIKEINYYSSKQALEISQVINPLETLRDPILQKFIHPAQSVTPANKAAYLLRIFFSEAKNLDAQLEGRSLKKWSYHLGKITNHLPLGLYQNTTYSSLLKIILSSYFDQDYNRYFLALSALQTSRKPDHVFFDESPFKSELLSLLPHRFCYRCDSLLNFSEKQSDLIQAQLNWEIWAMYTQPVNYKNRNQVTEHLENIYTFLKLLDKNKTDQSIKALTKLIESLPVF